MKKILIASLVLISFNLFASSSTTVIETAIGGYDRDTTLSTKFYFDLNSGQAYAKLYKEDEYCWAEHECTYNREGSGSCHLVTRCSTDSELVERAPIEGLTTDGRTMFYVNNGVQVKCGTIGRTRILRRVSLRFNGKCQLKAKLNRATGEAVVKFITK